MEINYFNVLLALLSRDYLSIDNPDLTDIENIFLGVLDSFVNGVIDNFEDIYNKGTKRLLQGCGVDNNILIDLRKKYNLLDNIYQELEEL